VPAQNRQSLSCGPTDFDRSRTKVNSISVVGSQFAQGISIGGNDPLTPSGAKTLVQATRVSA
jgi:hypothetical protein